MVNLDFIADIFRPVLNRQGEAARLFFVELDIARVSDDHVFDFIENSDGIVWVKVLAQILQDDSHLGHLGDFLNPLKAESLKNGDPFFGENFLAVDVDHFLVDHERNLAKMKRGLKYKNKNLFEKVCLIGANIGMAPRLKS